MNDRALRNIVLGLGGAANGVPREDGFDITVASEVMAILCLARDLADLQDAARRASSSAHDAGRPRRRRARDLKADGAMAALMKDALQPEPGADPGGHAGARARRALRQHRAWLQQRHRHPAGACRWPIWW